MIDMNIDTKVTVDLRDAENEYRAYSDSFLEQSTKMTLAKTVIRPLEYRYVISRALINKLIREKDVDTSRWEHVSGDTYRCQKCGSKTLVDEMYHVPKYLYCPYCGRMMI